MDWKYAQLSKLIMNDEFEQKCLEYELAYQDLFNNTPQRGFIKC